MAYTRTPPLGREAGSVLHGVAARIVVTVGEQDDRGALELLPGGGFGPAEARRGRGHRIADRGAVGAGTDADGVEHRAQIVVGERQRAQGDRLFSEGDDADHVERAALERGAIAEDEVAGELAHHVDARRRFAAKDHIARQHAARAIHHELQAGAAIDLAHAPAGEARSGKRDNQERQRSQPQQHGKLPPPLPPRAWQGRRGIASCEPQGWSGLRAPAIGARQKRQQRERGQEPWPIKPRHYSTLPTDSPAAAWLLPSRPTPRTARGIAPGARLGPTRRPYQARTSRGRTRAGIRPTRPAMPRS